MAIRIPWTKYEVALLIDACIRFDNTQCTRTEAIKGLSKTLRELAIKNKLEIDDIYRNENGISIQFQLMQGLLHDEVSGLRNSSKLFVEMKELYNQNKSEYEKILKEAQAMLECNKKNRDNFVEWLSSQVSPAQLSEIYLVYDKIDKFCLKRGILKKSLLETTDIKVVNKVLKTVEQNKVFRFTHKREINKIVSAVRSYYTYIKNEENNRDELPAVSSAGISLCEKEEKFENECSSRTQPITGDDESYEIKKNNGETRTKQDEYLLEKYPVAYIKVKDSLQKSLDVVGEKGVTPNAIYENIKHIARIDAIEYILENASWAKNNGTRYVYSQEIIEKAELTEETSETVEKSVKEEFVESNVGNKVDFNNLTNLAYTKPLSISYFDEKITDLRSWTDLYVKFISFLYEDYPDGLPIGEYFHGAGRIDFGDYSMSEDMVAPKQICDNLYVETNLSATNIVSKIKALLDHCLIDYENIVIYYESKDSSTNTVTNEYEAARMVLEADEFESDDELEEAYYRYKKAAELGNIDGMYNLGLYYLNDLFVEQNDETALYWLEKAANNGHSDAANDIGVYYHNSKNLRGKHSKAIKWYKRGAELGNKYSQCNLGWHYEYGMACEVDLSLAKKYYELSAEQGFEDAIKYLKRLNGKLNPTNYSEVLILYSDWLCKEKGMSEATSKGYASSVKVISEKALEWKLLDKLIYEITDTEELKKSVEILFSNEEFQKYNEEQHNRFTASLNRFMEYMGITMTYGRNPYTEKENAFFEWLLNEKGLSMSTCRAYKSGLNMIIRFIQKHDLTEKSIFDTDDDKVKQLFEKLLKDSEFSSYSDENYSRPKSAMYKYLEFISGSVVDVKETIDIDLSPYEIILEEAFPRGFRLESAIEIKKFKRQWASLNGEEYDLGDEKIEQYIKYCGVVYDGRVYSPSSMVSEELEIKLFSYINHSFSSGVNALYFEALFNEFSDDFLEHCMYNSEMLKEYLAFVNKGQYYINDNYISKDANITVDPTEEVKSCMVEAATPMLYDEIYEKLSHIAPQKIKQVLNFNSDFISNGRGEYFHIDITVLTDDYLDEISALILDAISEKKFISGNELIEAISIKHPYIIENNSTISELGLRNAIGYKLKTKFSFEGNIISKLDEHFSMMDVFAEFCKKRSSFTLDELRVLKQEISPIIYFEAVYENSLRISQTNFVSKEQAMFDTTATDLAIDRFCTGEYISIKKIDQFGSFPDAGFQWNCYLLEHYAAMYSPNYKLIHCTFNEMSCVGAIVKKTSYIETFDDLIIDALANSYIELDKESALQFLCDEGYLARRRYSGIEEVLIKANELRNQKGN